MRYIAGGLSTFIIIVLVNGMLALLRKPVKLKSQTVILPRFLLILGIICSVVFLIPSIITLFLIDSVVASIIFAALSLLGTSLIIAYFNCRITYNETTFTVKNFLGFKHTYTYNEITAIRGWSMDIKLYVGKRVVRIDELAIGKYEFLGFAKKQYQKLYNGKAIPTAAHKTDIFNGNVEQVGEFVFIYILIGLLCIGMIVFLAITSAPKAAEDLDYASLSFERYEIHDENLQLYANGDSKYYSIFEYEELLLDVDAFIALCNSGETFDVGYVLYDDADIPHYGLESVVGNDGTIYLTMEDVHKNRWGDIWMLYLIFGGMTVIWLVFVVLSIYVGRNPEKFSRRFVRLFFKDGYIRRSFDKNKRH